MDSRSCANCHIQFSRARDLRRHLRTSKAHKKQRYPCPICTKEFTRSDVLKRHQASLGCINRFLGLITPIYNLDIHAAAEAA